MAAKKQESLSETIRRLVDETLAEGLTVYALAKVAGIERAALARFLTGKSGLNTESVDRLAAVLGWKIVVDPKRRQAAIQATKIASKSRKSRS